MQHRQKQSKPINLDEIESKQGQGRAGLFSFSQAKTVLCKPPLLFRTPKKPSLLILHAPLNDKPTIATHPKTGNPPGVGAGVSLLPRKVEP